MTLSATVYTKPDCVQCDRVKKLLDDRGIEVELIDITEDPDHLRIAQDLGYKAAPVTFVVDRNGDVIDHFSGFAITKLNNHFPKNTTTKES